MRTPAIFQKIRQSAALRDSLIMTVAMVGAGGFDYLTNFVAGRQLQPAQFATFIAVAAILQILLNGTNVIRNVVAFYVAAGDGLHAVAPFYKKSRLWAWKWGVGATLLMAALSPWLSRWLKIDSIWPMLAASAAVLMFFVRPVTDGTLQGLQRFLGLSAVQTGQALLRFLFALLLITLGWNAFGAILALPLATTAAYFLAIWLLRDVSQTPITEKVAPISLAYTGLTLIGLVSYAFMVNMDAILVKAFFSEIEAGSYSTVVTLGKINTFVPLAMGMVLFPKAIARHNSGQNPRPLLLMALAVVMASGALLTGVFFMVPNQIVAILFKGAYADPGVVLGMVGIATTLYAGVNIWVNYALSTSRPRFLYLLAFITALQAAAMFRYHTSTAQIAGIMITAGVLANIAGLLTLLPNSLERTTHLKNSI